MAPKDRRFPGESFSQGCAWFQLCWVALIRTTDFRRSFGPGTGPSGTTTTFGGSSAPW